MEFFLLTPQTIFSSDDQNGERGGKPQSKPECGCGYLKVTTAEGTPSDVRSEQRGLETERMKVIAQHQVLCSVATSEKSSSQSGRSVSLLRPTVCHNLISKY